MAKQKFNHKEKNKWKSFEIYLDKSGDYEKPYIKPSLDYFESAKKHFEEFDYLACANYLRKEVERLKKIKEREEESINQDEKIFKKMLFSSDFEDTNRLKRRLIGFKKGIRRGVKNYWRD